MIAFNEAMEIGTPLKKIFTDEFIEERARSLDVKKELYESKTIKELKPFFENKDEDIYLLFDRCPLCQINIITILAYLEYTKYSGEITLEYRTIEKAFVKRIKVSTSGFYQIYIDVLIDKKMRKTNEEVMDNGIKRYIEEKRWQRKVKN